MALPDKVQQLDQRIAEAVRGALQGLREEIGDRLRQNSAAIQERLENLESALGVPLLAAEDLKPLADEAAVTGRREAFSTHRRALVALDRAASQAEILGELLESSSRFASRSALFLTRSEGVQGWGSYGFSDTELSVADLAFPYGEGSPWARLVAGRGVVEMTAAECAQISSRLESQIPKEAVLIPLLLGDRLAAAFYADRLADAGPLEIEALQTLVYAAALGLETLPLRRGARASTLAAPGEEEAGRPLAFWQPPVEGAPAEEEPPVEAPPPPPPLGPVTVAEEAGEEQVEEAPEEEVLSAFEVVEEETLESEEPEELAVAPVEEEAGREEGGELPSREQPTQELAGEGDELPSWEQPTQELTKEISRVSAGFEPAPEPAAPAEAPEVVPEEEPSWTAESPAWSAGEETPVEVELESPLPTAAEPPREEPPTADLGGEAGRPPLAEGGAEEVEVEALPQIEEPYEPESGEAAGEPEAPDVAATTEIHPMDPGSGEEASSLLGSPTPPTPNRRPRLPLRPPPSRRPRPTPSRRPRPPPSRPRVPSHPPRARAARPRSARRETSPAPASPSAPLVRTPTKRRCTRRAVAWPASW